MKPAVHEGQLRETRILDRRRKGLRGAMTQERQLDPQALGDHIDRLYRTARGLCRSREEAEDLVQETFARVLRKPRTLSADDDIAYLLRALQNTFVSTRRTASRRPQTEPRSDQLELVEDRRAVRAEASAEAAEVYAAISVLPDDFRDALVTIDVVGLSYREAARALGAREATITTRLHRARQRVADTLLADDEAPRRLMPRAKRQPLTARGHRSSPALADRLHRSQVSPEQQVGEPAEREPNAT